MYIVYKHTCVSTGKSYIGFTKHDINVRWKQHVKQAKKKAIKGKGKFQYAILKYGVGSFIHEILFESESKSEALLMEVELIKKYDTIKNGYNFSPGGLGCGCGGGKKTEEQKRRMSEIKKGIKLSEEHKQSMRGPRPNTRGENHCFYGKTLSEETKKKISNSLAFNGKSHHLYNKPATYFKSGKDHPRAQPVIINGTLYESMRLASTALGVGITTVQRWVSKYGTIFNKDFKQCGCIGQGATSSLPS